MNYEKYEQIKKQYCVEVSQVDFSILDNNGQSNIISGDSLTFNANNGVVSFIDENGISYVTPFYEVINTLDQAGYNQAGLYVPFADNKWLNNGTHSQRWQQLLAQNRRNKLENVNIVEQFNIEENKENTFQI